MVRVLCLVVTALLVLSVAADWQQVYPSGYQPAARKFHSAVVQGSDVLFFGGTNGASSFNDIFSWNIGEHAHTLSPSLSPSLARLRAVHSQRRFGALGLWQPPLRARWLTTLQRRT